MKLGRFLLMAATAAALTTPAPALAATLQPIKPCYISVDRKVREQVPLAGSGFAPSTVLDLTVDGVVVGEATTDEAGAFGPVPVSAPHQRKGVRGFAVTVAERGNPASATELRALVTALSLNLNPSPRRARQRVTWQGRGYTGKGRVYAHYLRNGKHRRTVRLGRPKGACGTLKVKRRQFPFKPRVGSWRIRIDHHRNWKAKPEGVFYTLAVDVSRAR